MNNDDRNEEHKQYVWWCKALSGRERHRIMTQLEFEGRRQLWISETAEHESQMRLQRLNEEIEKINKRYRKQMWFGRIAFLVVGIGAFLILCSCAHVSDKRVTIENLYVDARARGLLS